nr:hypothetical protein [Legionella jordanis]
MLEKIQNLIANLGKKSKAYVLNQKDWFNILIIYLQSNADERELLAKGVQPYAQMEVLDVFTSLEEQSELQGSKIPNFAKRVASVLPNISRLNLSKAEWLQLIRRTEEQDVKRLSSAFLLSCLSQIRGDAESLDLLQGRKQLPRHVKKAPAPEESTLHRVKRRRFRNDDSEDLPILFSDNNKENEPDLSNIKVRRIDILSPGTPVKGYPEVYRTPEKQTRVRKLYGHRTGLMDFTLFKALTPSPKKVQITVDDEETVKKKMPKLLFQQLEPLSFTATLEALKKRRGLKRRQGQNQLMGGSCQQVFAICGENIVIESQSKYHWSHLIAYFLGGMHSADNLVPATAASNYNVLEIIEQFIAEKLIKEDISDVYITVSPVYIDGSNIPSTLLFNLKWLEHSVEHSEEIHINPRSHERVNKSMLKAIDAIRNLRNPDAEQMQVEDQGLKLTI